MKLERDMYRFAENEGRMQRPSVPTSSPHQAIGSALRSAFLPRASDMPDDIATLLNKLD